MNERMGIFVTTAGQTVAINPELVRCLCGRPRRLLGSRRLELQSLAAGSESSSMTTLGPGFAELAKTLRDSNWSAAKFEPVLQKLLNWLVEKVFEAQRRGVRIDAGSRYFKSLIGVFCTFGPQVPDMSALFLETKNRVISNVWVVGSKSLELRTGLCLGSESSSMTT
jgi:hypothetical protein